MSILKMMFFLLLTSLNLQASYTPFQTNPNNETITYTYDGVGNIIEIETTTQTITKSYDALNRLESVTDAKGTTTYAYDAIGRQTQITYPNGATTHYTYNSRNWVTKVDHKDSTGTVLQSFTYTLDNVGNRTQIVENTGRTTDYTYNTVHQLVSETVTNDPNGLNTVTTYSYDLVGNLLTKTVDGVETTYSYNNNDQLTEQGTITFTYDANGNLIAKDDTTYSYDERNRLIEVVTPTDTIEYTYDANNNRIAKTTVAGTTTYLVDVNTPYAQVITESKENGTTIEYTYGNDLISNGEHYFLTDALGSTRGLIDETEQLTDTYNYTPYGELSNHTGTSENSFLYTGEQFDPETEDYFLRARYYNPNSARFLSRDTYDGTAGNPITQNHYLYGNSNPTMYVDPSGKFGIVAGFSSLARVMTALPRLVSFGAPRLLSGAGAIPRVLPRGAAATNKSMSVSQMSYLLTLARLASRFGADTRDGDSIPIQVYGSDVFPDHQRHIFDAMFVPWNWSSNKWLPSTPIVHRKRPPNDRGWMDEYLPSNSQNGCRDEYPFASTYEGGESSKISVSLRYVSCTESTDQGGFMSSFYTGASVNDRDTFIVVPLGGESGFYDKRGNYKRYIPRRRR